MRYPATQGKRDANEAEIVRALEGAGATVEQIPTGRGVCDLLVGRDNVNYLLEVKMRGCHLNAKQVAWHGYWKGQKCVVRSPHEALDAIGLGIDMAQRARNAGVGA